MVEVVANQSDFVLEEELDRIQGEDVMGSVATFLDVNTPLPVRVTTAQQICNMNDHKEVALVFDMRSAAAYNECSLDKSINLPLERFKEDTFINWAQRSKQIEQDATVLKNKYEIDRMKKRKRRYCYIIAGQQT